MCSSSGGLDTDMNAIPKGQIALLKQKKKKNYYLLMVKNSNHQKAIKTCAKYPVLQYNEKNFVPMKMNFKKKNLFFQPIL